jgi:hypothetical protein
MKTKINYFTLLALMAAFWGTWSFAHHRGFAQGYSQGSRDEFYTWEQKNRIGSSWDGIVTSRRDMSKLLGGSSAPQVVRVSMPTFELNKQTGKVVQMR